MRRLALALFACSLFACEPAVAQTLMPAPTLTATAARLSWTPVAGATRYRIYTGV